jgi:hypothetical protein
MKYLPLHSFPEFEENPFLENAIQEIQEHTIRKRVFIKGNRSVVNHIVNDNGEIVGYSSFLRNIECDEAQFVKFYLSRFAAFYNLTKSARKVFGYILTKCIIPNRDVFYIDYEEAKQITGYSADNIIRTGLSSLVEQGIIARSRNPYKYYINPLVVFNGDRITFAETYIKRKSDSKSFINSKLNNNE